MSQLVERRCKPCEGGVEPLTRSQSEELLRALHEHWNLSDNAGEIQREFLFPGFSRTMAFVNAVAWVATTEGHHPTLTVSYGRVLVTYTTTAIKGLSDNDFICAAKIDRLAADA